MIDIIILFLVVLMIIYLFIAEPYTEFKDKEDNIVYFKSKENYEDDDFLNRP